MLQMLMRGGPARGIYAGRQASASQTSMLAIQGGQLKSWHHIECIEAILYDYPDAERLNNSSLSEATATNDPNAQF